MTPTEAFKRAFIGHPNLITQRVIRYGTKNRHLYEISVGEFMNQKMWGVTVLNMDASRDMELDRPFYSLEAAESYIKNNFQEIPPAGAS